MKKYIFLLLSISFVLMQCTPKTGDVVSKTNDATKKATDAVASKSTDFRSMAPAAGPARAIEIADPVTFKLDNGLQVIVSENHKLPRVSFQLTVDLPPIQEGDKAGAASIAGQMVNKGTSSKSKAEIDEAVDFIGASLNTGAGGVFGASLTKHKEKLLAIMADVLKNPSFPESEFEKIKKQTLSGLQQAKDDPDAIASNVSNVMRYGKDHPYGEIETEETIKAVELKDVKDFYNKQFTPAQSYLVVVGDINKAEAQALTRKYFGDWKGGAKQPKQTFKKPTAPEKTQVDFVNKDGAVQSVVTVTYPIDLKPGTTEGIKARVMNTILGGGASGRLFLNLREDKAYTYGAYSQLSSDKEVGYFSASASVRNEVTDSAVAEFVHELDKMRQVKVTDDELNLAKNAISGSFARSLESPQTVARFALNKFRYKLSDDYYQTYLKKVNAVTKEDIMMMAKKYLQPENAHIVVVGSKSEVAERLAKFAGNGKINYYDYKGDPVEDANVDVGDMTAQKVVEDYLAALGGADKLKAIKDVKVVQKIEVQGMAIASTLMVKGADKFVQEQAMNGNVMGKTVINGDKGAMTQMGNKQNLEGEQLAAMKREAKLFPELTYATDGVKIVLEGVESVDGVNAYKIVAETSDGSKSTSFYDISNGLKIKRVATMQAGPQTITQTTTFKDYKAVDGILFPFTSEVSGLMPMTVTAKTESVEINKGLDDSVFAIE